MRCTVNEERLDIGGLPASVANTDNKPENVTNFLSICFEIWSSGIQYPRVRFQAMSKFVSDVTPTGIENGHQLERDNSSVCSIIRIVHKFPQIQYLLIFCRAEEVLCKRRSIIVDVQYGHLHCGCGPPAPTGVHSLNVHLNLCYNISQVCGHRYKAGSACHLLTSHPFHLNIETGDLIVTEGNIDWEEFAVYYSKGFLCPRDHNQ